MRSSSNHELTVLKCAGGQEAEIGSLLGDYAMIKHTAIPHQGSELSGNISLSTRCRKDYKFLLPVACLPACEGMWRPKQWLCVIMDEMNSVEKSRLPVFFPKALESYILAE